MGKRVGLPTEKARKVDFIYFAGFKCALEDCYKPRHIDIHSRFVLKIGYGLPRFGSHDPVNWRLMCMVLCPT